MVPRNLAGLWHGNHGLPARRGSRGPRRAPHSHRRAVDSGCECAAAGTTPHLSDRTASLLPQILVPPRRGGGGQPLRGDRLAGAALRRMLAVTFLTGKRVPVSVFLLFGLACSVRVVCPRWSAASLAVF